jgi:hypothetical protein
MPGDAETRFAMYGQEAKLEHLHRCAKLIQHWLSSAGCGNANGDMRRDAGPFESYLTSAQFIALNAFLAGLAKSVLSPRGFVSSRASSLATS